MRGQDRATCPRRRDGLGWVICNASGIPAPHHRRRWTPSGFPASSRDTDAPPYAIPNQTRSREKTEGPAISRQALAVLVGRVGIEPTTNGLRVQGTRAGARRKPRNATAVSCAHELPRSDRTCAEPKVGAAGRPSPFTNRVNELPRPPPNRSRTCAALFDSGRSQYYSITSSALPNSDCGIVRPRAFAVLRLMTKANFVGRSTGRSAGLAPLRILST